MPETEPTHSIYVTMVTPQWLISSSSVLLNKQRLFKNNAPALKIMLENH